MYTNIDQTLVNSVHGLLNCEIGGLDWCVITTEYRTRVHCITDLYTILQNVGYTKKKVSKPDSLNV